jgi:hypothetical protein
MFAKATIGLAVILVAASSALAAMDAAKAQHNPWESHSATAPTFDELYDHSCHSSHPVFSCPGSGGQ